MNSFDELVAVVETLLGPNGCPWDKEQTLETIRPFLIEEVYEIVEAIDKGDNHDIEEEIGDVLFQLVLLCKLAERDARFTLEGTLQKVKDKLIRRHPHIFNEVANLTTEEVLKQWDELKKKEKTDRKNLLDDIPKGLPALARAHKMASRFKKANFDANLALPLSNEEEYGKKIYQLLVDNCSEGLYPENALLKYLSQLEQSFRERDQIN